MIYPGLLCTLFFTCVDVEFALSDPATIKSERFLGLLVMVILLITV